MKLVYMRTDEYNHFICVHESQLNDAKTALKDIDGISYIRGADTDKFRFKPVDIWVAIVHDIKLQVLDALKTAGFEFSDMVQKDYDYLIGLSEAPKSWEYQRTREDVKTIQWCDKYGCSAPNGCGDCKRQIYGCHTIMLKVKVS